MRVPDPKVNTTTEAYLAYKAGYLEESELKPKLYKPDWHFDGWLAYWAGLTNEYPTKENGDPEMLCDEEALVAYLSGVTDTYPEEIKDPYDVRIVGYLKHLASVRWPEPDYPVNNEEFYLSTMEPTHTSNPEPSSNIELDTAEGKIISVEAYGDTYQQTYSGKNLFSSVIVVGGITASGYLSNFTTRARSRTKVAVQPNTEYTLSMIPKDAAKTINMTVQGWESDDTFISQITGSSWVTVPVTFTTPANCTQITISGRYSDDTSFGTLGAETDVFQNIQLELGSSPTSYEPYTGGPAPNPDYPQPIQVVTGGQTVTVCGKNLFDIRNATGTRGNNTVVASGQTIVVNSNTNGTETAFYLNECSYISQYVPSSYTDARDYNMTGMGGDYTLKVYYRNIPSGTGTLNTSIYTNKQQILKNRASIVGGVIEVAISLDADEYIKSIVLYTSNANVFSNFTIKAQLEQGSTPTTYEPYTSQSYPLSLGSIELCKIGTYQDYIYQSEGDWYVHKDMGKQVLNGTENIYNKDMSSGFTRIYFPLTGQVNVGNMRNATLRSDYFNASVDNNYGTAFLNNARMYVYPQSTITTVEEFKTWLSSNNTTFYYPLATPTDTKITDATLVGQLDALAGADTYNEKTYIKVTANDPNLPALLKVDAYKY